MKSLKRTIIGNAIFSGISGILLAFMSNSIAELLEIPFPIIIQIVGWILIGFSVALVVIANKALTRFWVNFIILQDFLWVLGTILILVYQPFTIGIPGIWSLLIVGIIVGVFMILQIHFQGKRTSING